MKPKTRTVFFAAILAVATLFPAVARAQGAIPGPCVPGGLPSGAYSLMCVPAAGWNGQLVVFAHGYVAFNQPLNFYNLTLADGTPLPALVQGLGYAFATTSYRQNGLAILEGADDIRELVAAFWRELFGPAPDLRGGRVRGRLTRSGTTRLVPTMPFKSSEVIPTTTI